MKLTTIPLSILFFITLVSTSCVSKKQFALLSAELEAARKDLRKCEQKATTYDSTIDACKREKATLETNLKSTQTTLDLREEQIDDLKGQINDLKNQRDKQSNQVDDLTVLSKSANENIKQTLEQLGKKDKYIRLLQVTKTKADSINLALAFNLKSVLKDGIDDKDIDIKVDKTVVFVNLSDKMLYQSGSSAIMPQAKVVLGKIAKIIKSRPELEVMVEGYTDNVPIRTDCLSDNWDLSVKRATSVVRVLQYDYNIDPNRLIAAGRGEYNRLVSNDTAANRAVNRRTRIIILPKLNQFYDLLNPKNIPD